MLDDRAQPHKSNATRRCAALAASMPVAPLPGSSFRLQSHCIALPVSASIGPRRFVTSCLSGADPGLIGLTRRVRNLPSHTFPRPTNHRPNVPLAAIGRLYLVVFIGPRASAVRRHSFGPSSCVYGLFRGGKIRLA